VLDQLNTLSLPVVEAVVVDLVLEAVEAEALVDIAVQSLAKTLVVEHKLSQQFIE